MSPALEMALIVTLSVLLAAVSGVAGMLCWRVRSVPLDRVARLARELAERQKALEVLIARLEAAEATQKEAPAKAPGPRPAARRNASTVRIDRAEPSAVAGPTLIAVPDLSMAQSHVGAPSAGSELSRRFGAIWDLADTGATADAIARTTGQPIGQVELILGLRRQLLHHEGRA